MSLLCFYYILIISLLCFYYVFIMSLLCLHYAYIMLLLQYNIYIMLFLESSRKALETSRCGALLESSRKAGNVAMWRSFGIVV